MANDGMGYEKEMLKNALWKFVPSAWVARRDDPRYVCNSLVKMYLANRRHTKVLAGFHCKASSFMVIIYSL